MKNEINKFEELANNTTKAKDKINTKLIECGGASATDLADVPNKIDGMLDSYFKLAAGEITEDLTVISSPDDGLTIGLQTKKINIPLNLNFTPKRVIVYITEIFEKISRSDTSLYKLTIDSAYNNSLKNGITGEPNIAMPYISAINNNSITIILRVKTDMGDKGTTTLKAPIHWLALG